MKTAARIAALVVSTSTAAEELPSTFDAAIANAERSRSSTRSYDAASFSPFFHEHVMSRCIQLSFKDKTPFSAVIVLDSEGRAIRVYQRPNTAVSKCIEERSLQTRFPVPPTAPYFALLELAF
jgi:hypothetical protein